MFARNIKEKILIWYILLQDQASHLKKAQNPYIFWAVNNQFEFVYNPFDFYWINTFEQYSSRSSLS